MPRVSPPKPTLYMQTEGEWDVYRVESESEPGQYHVVAVRYVYVEGFDFDFQPVEWVCSCKGYNYNKNCWHIYELGYKDDGD